jgi:hypothetical protein
MTQQPDPIAEAFRTFQKRPKDIVRRTSGDGTPIPTGHQPVHDDYLDGDGMTRDTSTEVIGTALYTTEQVLERKRQRDERDA